MISPSKLDSTEHIVLYDVPWEAYERILEAFGERRFRHTYDHGVLEIMSPSKRRERAKSFLARLIGVVALEWDIEIDAIGSTTLKKEPQLQGLEPDECFYIEHACQSLKHADYDPDRDPPPDLAVEVDVTHSSVGRMPVYAALGVPEVWRYAADKLTFYRLSPDGEYAAVEQSLALHRLPAQVVENALRPLGARSANEIIREFAQWLREHRSSK
jgi:Uma2 family endonuclease